MALDGYGEFEDGGPPRGAAMGACEVSVAHRPSRVLLELTVLKRGDRRGIHQPVADVIRAASTTLTQLPGGRASCRITIFCNPRPSSHRKVHPDNARCTGLRFDSRNGQIALPVSQVHTRFRAGQSDRAIARPRHRRKSMPAPAYDQERRNDPAKIASETFTRASSGDVENVGHPRRLSCLKSPVLEIHHGGNGNERRSAHHIASAQTPAGAWSPAPVTLPHLRPRWIQRGDRSPSAAQIFSRP